VLKESKLTRLGLGDVGTLHGTFLIIFFDCFEQTVKGPKDIKRKN
jgi:hypothetical protein